MALSLSAQYGPTWPTPEVLMERAHSEKTVGIITASVGAAAILIGEITNRQNDGAVENADAHLIFGVPLVAVGVTLNLTSSAKTKRALSYRHAEIR